MAEARNISSAADLYSVLLDSGLYERVELSSAGTVVTCYDKAGNAVLRTTGNTDIAGYTDATHSLPGITLGTITHAYLCESGVMLTKYYDGTLRYVFVLTKTNTGAPALVIHHFFENKWNAITWGDVTPLSDYSMPAKTASQYAMFPFVTHAALGISSFTPDAFYAAVTTGNTQPRSILMQGARWFAVGNAVLRDGSPG